MRTTLAAAALALALAGGARAQEPINLDDVMTGVQDVAVSAPGAARVAYLLDGRNIGIAQVTGERAELAVDFGSMPFPHTITFAAYDAHGALLGERKRRVNIGGRAADLTFIEPSGGARAIAGSPIALCAQLPPGEQPASAVLSTGGEPQPLTQVRDKRCDGIAYSAVLTQDDARYLEAQVTTTAGRALTDAIAINADHEGFSDRITVRLMQYLVRPVDHEGKVIPDLDADAFHVREDRMPLKVHGAMRVSDAPIDIAIVLDASVSTLGDDALEQTLVDGVLGLFDPAKDRAIVYAIGKRPIPLQSAWSRDPDVLARALRRAARLEANDGSAVYDTLEDVLYRFQTSSRDGTAAGAILFMTDGDDTTYRGDARQQERILRYAQASGIQVYPISVALPLPAPEPRCDLMGQNKVADAFLDALVQRTGGERTTLTLAANPGPFLRAAEDVATELKRLRDQGTEWSLKEAQRRDRCIGIYLEKYEAQQRLAQRDVPAAQRVRDAIAHAGSLLRQQYIVMFQTGDDGRPRERSLRFEIADPRVVAVKAPTGAYY